MLDTENLSFQGCVRDQRDTFGSPDSYPFPPYQSPEWPCASSCPTRSPPRSPCQPLNIPVSVVLHVNGCNLTLPDVPIPCCYLSHLWSNRARLQNIVRPIAMLSIVSVTNTVWLFQAANRWSGCRVIPGCGKLEEQASECRILYGDAMLPKHVRMLSGARVQEFVIVSSTVSTAKVSNIVQQRQAANARSGCRAMPGGGKL